MDPSKLPTNWGDTYEELGSLIRRTDIVMICLSAAFVCGRLYSRRLSKMHMWWDDYFIIAGLVRLVIYPADDLLLLKFQVLAWASSLVVLESLLKSLLAHRVECLSLSSG